MPPCPRAVGSKAHTDSLPYHVNFEDLERVAGIEPAPRAWKARVIPFHHTRPLTMLVSSWVIGRQVELWRRHTFRSASRYLLCALRARAASGTAEAVGRLRATGLSVRLLTNSMRVPKRVIIDELSAIGFAVDAFGTLKPAGAAYD